MKDRILGKNGFEPFPKRLEEKAIKQGNKPVPPDTGEPEPLLHSNAKAKQELLLKMNEDAKKQAEMDKLIKERQAKAALEAKAYEEAKLEDEKAKSKKA